MNLTATLGAAAIAAAGLFGQVAAAKAADVRFYPIEAFTIVYAHQGMQSGTTTVHTRDYGRLRAEWRELTMSFAGIVQQQKERVVIDGPSVTTIDLKTNTATRIKNPMYDNILAGMERYGGDGVETGKAFMRGMGGVETGESKTIAGEVCAVWQIPQLSQTHCITEDGLALEIASAMMGMQMSQVATEVRRGDGGADEAFSLEGVTVNELALPPGMMGMPRR